MDIGPVLTKTSKLEIRFQTGSVSIFLNVLTYKYITMCDVPMLNIKFLNGDELQIILNSIVSVFATPQYI